jgi:Fe-S cluster assembly iron-binding protein IscA
MHMFQVTERASDMIKEALKDREDSLPIRILMRGG